MPWLLIPGVILLVVGGWASHEGDTFGGPLLAIVGWSLIVAWFATGI